MSIPRSNTRPFLARSLTALALAAAGFTTSALAGPVVTHTEIGDAGETLSTAQATFGFDSPLSNIYGSLSGKFDVDLYLINITNFAAFSATTVNSGTDALLDTQLFLLTTSGKAVCMNDNALGDPNYFHSTLGVGACSSAYGNGLYLLGIASGFYDAVDGNNDLLFATGLDTDVRGAGSSFTLAGYIDNGAFDPNAGVYNIQLTGAASVPEPATLLLAFGALAGCGWTTSRRQRPSTKTSA